MRLQTVLEFLYLGERRAAELGFTREGRLFGVPAWMREAEPNVFHACPKIPALQLWAIFADAALDAFLLFVPGDEVIEAPVYPTRRIGEAPA